MEALGFIDRTSSRPFPTGINFSGSAATPLLKTTNHRELDR